MEPDAASAAPVTQLPEGAEEEVSKYSSLFYSDLFISDQLPKSPCDRMTRSNIAAVDRVRRVLLLGLQLTIIFIID